MTNIVGTPEFIKNLDGWLFENEQKYAKYIAKNKSKLPPMFTAFSGMLYRGMVVDTDFLDGIRKGGITFRTLTSWSKDPKIGAKFVNDPKYKIATKQGGMSVLISKKITTKVVFDIHGFILFMGNPQLEMLGMDELSIDSGMQEQEVLINTGVKILQKDLSVI